VAALPGTGGTPFSRRQLPRYTETGFERLPEPVAAAFAELKARLRGHEVEFRGPGITQGQRMQMHSMPVRRDFRVVTRCWAASWSHTLMVAACSEAATA
jgi:hypothetical protein